MLCSIVELSIIAVIPLVLNLFYKLKEVDIMDVIYDLIIEIVIQLIVGGINGPLAVEKE